MNPPLPPRGLAQRFVPVAVLLAAAFVCAFGAPAAAASGATATGAAADGGAAAGASRGPCPGDAGVTIVVDPGDLGGSVEVRCVESSPADGFKALVGAGFDFDATVSFSGFLCRIDGRPATDPCASTPPANAYWSYWVADRGGPWCYSSLGAAARRPPQGTVEGWSFSREGKAAAPRSGTFQRLAGLQRLPEAECERGPAPATAPGPTAPTAVAPPAPAPPTPSVASETTTAPRVPGTTRPGAETTTTSAPTAPVAAPPTTAVPAAGAPEATTTTATTTSTTDPAGGDTDGDEQAASTVELAESGRSGPGSAVGTALAVSAMGLLAGGAVLVNRRRLRPLAAVATGDGSEPT